jgi:predicted dehydrogenase
MVRRALVIGAGSIGRRHARNLAAIAGTEIAIVDADPARARDAAADSGATVFPDLDAALGWKPAGVVVATPNDLHLIHAAAALDAGADVLIEKPISHRVEGVGDLLDKADRLGRRVFVGCNMRYHPGPATLRAAIGRIGRPLFARARYGNHLPSMRPGIDYRKLYCARRETGGGVVLDSIHEIDYVAWLLGPIDEVTCDSSRISELEIEAEDYAAIALRHVGGARADILLDYLQRFKRRGCEIVGTQGTLDWSSEGKSPEHCTVRLYEAASGTWATLHADDALDPNAMYLAMLREFVSVLGGAAPVHLLDGRGGLASLVAAHAALRASDEGKRQRID